MVAMRQSGFQGGLIGPQLLGRAELAKYQSGLRTLSNMVITRTGAMENRGGTMYVDTAANGGDPVRLVKFGSTPGQALLLVFGDLTLRFFKNGAAIAHATTLGAWGIGTAYTHGQVVTYSGVQYYCLADNTGHQPNTSAAYWYAQTSAALELPTVIPQASLASFQVAQINDVMFVANQAFHPQQLSRYADDNWTIGEFVISAGVDAPANVTATPGQPSATVSSPSNFHASGGIGVSITRYEIVSFKNSTGAVSQTNQAVSPGNPTGGNPVTLTWNSVGAADGYVIFRDSATGPFGVIGVTSDTTFVDSAEVSIHAGATAVLESNTANAGSTVFSYVVTTVSATTGVESLASTVATCTGATPSSAHPNIISWDAADDAAKYNIYKSANGVYGFIGSSNSTTFRDINIIAAISQQPPVDFDLFGSIDDYPAVVGSYQQRLLFANTVNQPQTVWASVVGVYSAFTTTLPALDSGAIQFTIAGRVRQYVQALVDIGKLIIHTSNGEYVANGNQFGAITPSAINLVQNGYAGSALIVPVSIGSTALFVQARGNILRDLEYSIYSTSFSGKDTTLYAPQLFENQTIVQIDWQQIYNSIVWVVQDNGALLGLTYIKDQEVWAWHPHATSGGSFEQVCVVQEDTQDVVYVVVARTINGATVRYIEKLAAREFADTVNLSDAIFTDCSLTYDGRNSGPTTITATTGATWTPQDSLTLTASAATFTAGDVGTAIVLQQLDSDGLVSDSITFDIIAYTSTTVVTALPQANVPTWAQDTATTSWGHAVHAFSGADHLEGEAISAQGDGSVVYNALTDGTPTVISGGAFTTQANYLVLTAGLPITAQFQTLPLEGGGKYETMGNKQQRVVEMTATLYNTRSGSFGQDFQHLYPWKQRGLQAEPMGSPPALFTGPTIIPISGSWQTTGQVCGQQTDPLPLAVSSIVVNAWSGS